MAATGSNGAMTATSGGDDLEIRTLIRAVVDHGSQRKDALAKRIKRAGPQLRRANEEEMPDSARDEINGLLDDVKRDVETRTASVAAPVVLAEDVPEDEIKGWLADAVIADRTMKSHEEMSQEARFDMPEPRETKRSFSSNPFKKKAAAAVAGAAAIPVIGAVASGLSGREADEALEAELAEYDADIGGDGFAQAVVDETADLSATDASEDTVWNETEVEAYVAEPDVSVEEAIDAENSHAFDAAEDEDQDVYSTALLADEPLAVATMPAAAMDAQTYKDDPEGLPIWLAMGIPIAAVSMVALVAGVNIVRENGAETVQIEAASLSPMTISYADASEVTQASAPVLANAPVIAPETTVAGIAPVEAVVQTDLATANAAVPNMTDVPKITEVIAPVARPEPAPAFEVAPVVLASAALPSLPSSKPSIAPRAPAAPARNLAASSSVAPARASSANVPSIKPQLASLPRSRRAAAVKATPAIYQPRTGAVPVRTFDGHLERGSAALVVNTIAVNMGSTLTKTEQRWLARDMERALDDEVDGRDVSLKSKRGDRISVLFADSGQELRQLTVAREHGVAPLPRQMVLEGGWYAARSDVQLRATPSLAGTFSNRMISKDTLIERMATVTDRYGDRWYLMGRNGIAVGYMSPADLMLAAATDRPLGLPYNRRHGEVAHEMLPVFTQCRTVFVGPLGETRQKISVCRNAKGNWVSASAGEVPTQQASAPRPEPIVLASAVGLSPELVPFEERSVRKSLTPKLVYARAGQVVKQTLADGRNVELTLGAKYEATRIVPVMRLEALGRIEKPVRLDARWMRVPGGATLRATPDYLTVLNAGILPAGSAVETIGTVVDDRGDDWVLVGRNGVGFGYVQPQELMPLAGNTQLQSISSKHTAAVVDLVDVVTDCRSVDYLGTGLDGTFTACQQPDGQWALSAEPQLRQLADMEPSSQVAP